MLTALNHPNVDELEAGQPDRVERLVSWSGLLKWLTDVSTARR
jgi:hypothetical protein